MASAKQLGDCTGYNVYEKSICEADGVTYFLAAKGREKKVGMVGSGVVVGEAAGEIDGTRVILGACDHENALAIRAALPWTAPRCIGLETSVGFGDRLGIATPGHIRSLRDSGVTPIFAQQSIREMNRTERNPDQVMDCATWGVLQEGYQDGFGSDADHLQLPEDIDLTVAAGFTMFTIDPGKHVVDEADTMSRNALEKQYLTLDFKVFDLTPDELKDMYVGKSFALDGGGTILLDEAAFLRAAVKYGHAILHTVMMYNHLETVNKRDFELEISVDETASPTTPGEHFFFANELKRLGVMWVSLAPRFIGDFEKGVDYKGDLDAFREDFAAHVAVMNTLGPYKISIHSGSDKFSIYPIIAELTEGVVHLKTAGTSYLEALRAVAMVDAKLYREILDFSRERYETDKATYHVSAELKKVPAAADLQDAELAGLLDQFDARQVFHVTFGSVLTAEKGEKFRTRIYAALENDEENHYAVLEKHLHRHVAPLAVSVLQE